MKMTSGIDMCGSPQNMFSRTSPHTVNATHDFSPNPSSPALSTSSSSSGTSKKADPPKRLRYWLIDMIDSGEIPGLRWENSSRTVFRIPWKHAGKNNWKEEDCKIFQAWAEHRGKYRKGDKVDPATWKTRLRCALNKLGDIKELKQESNLDGNDPYRVYQLMPEQDRAQEPEIYPRDTWTKESSRLNSTGSGTDLEAYATFHQHNIQMPDSTSFTQQAQRFRGEMGAPYYGRETVAPSQQYHNLPFGELNRHGPRATNDKIHAMQSAEQTTGPTKSSFSYRRAIASFEQNQSASQHMQAANRLISSHGLNQDPFKMDVETVTCQNGSGIIQPIIDYGPPPSHEMEVYIRYRGNLISSHHVTVATGCRVYYGDADLQHIAMQTHKLPSGIFGSDDLYQIGLPECESFSDSPKQTALTKHVLNNIIRGLIISYDKGCFYTRRLCQSRVFVFGPESQGDTPEKLDRDAKVKVFDYENFHSELRRCVTEGRFKLPQIEVKASFGQTWSIKTSIEKNLVTLYMIPRAARYYINKVRESYPDVASITSINSIQESGPDSLDRLAERATRMSGECLNKLLLNIDPNAIHPLSEAPVNRPVITTAPTTSSVPQINQFDGSGFFQPNVLPIAPLVPASMDVEMTGRM